MLVKSNSVSMFRNIIMMMLIGATAQSASNVDTINYDGPNCINGAMVATGLNKVYRYASNNEMWTMLKSPLCRRLANNEARRKKDIGIIIDNGPHSDKNIISHAFVQLESDLYFEKHGYSKMEPYQNVNLKSILNDYNFDSNPACVQNQFDRGSCHVGTDFYRCESLDQFISENRKKIRSHTYNYFRDLENLELKLQGYLNNLDLPENTNKHLEIERELQMLADKMNNIPSSSIPEENILIKIIANRFVSIAGQLNAIQHPEIRDVVWKWENQDKNIEDVFEAILKLDIQDDLDLVYANIRAHFKSVMGPLVKALRNVDLVVGLNDEYRTNAGGVSLYKKFAQIEMGHDMHRVKEVTPDGYMAILCHESGHLLGGKPYSDSTSRPTDGWESTLPSSAEPQSDYYSATCMKKVFAFDTPNILPTDYSATPKIKKLCELTYSTVLEQNICKRSASAGLELMNYISSIYNSLNNTGKDFVTVGMDTPEKAGLSVGQLYPSPQCRLDTIIAGALNQKRPACWFVDTLK